MGNGTGEVRIVGRVTLSNCQVFNSSATIFSSEKVKILWLQLLECEYKYINFKNVLGCDSSILRYDNMSVIK